MKSRRYLSLFSVNNRKLTRLSLRIDPARICFLRFILEGYDGLAFISTVDAKEGLVELIYPASVVNEVFSLLNDLADSLKNNIWSTG